MTKDEAMKLALEALEDVQEMMTTSDWFNERVQAVRQALAEPEQPVSFYVYEWVNQSDGIVFRSFRHDEHHMGREPDRTIAFTEPDTGTDRGAWSDVPNATKWVDELRGDEDLDEPPNSTTDVVEPTDSLSTLLWRDLKTDRQRADWLRLGMGYQTGVVAAAIQQELAMAYERLVGFQKIHAALEQPEREWVGLTDEEIIKASIGNVEGEHMLPHSFARAIEKLLREKNHD